MTNEGPSEFGVLRFMPIETFNDPTHGLDMEARAERIAEAYSSDELPKPQNIGDWPCVQTAIRRGDLFVIETTMPNFRATLRFSPAKPETGDYEIHHRPRGGVERGRTVKVTAVPADDKDGRVSMLSSFPTRYAVVTVGAERPHSRKMWLFGLKSFRSNDDDMDVR